MLKKKRNWQYLYRRSAVYQLLETKKIRAELAKAKRELKAAYAS